MEVCPVQLVGLTGADVLIQLAPREDATTPPPVTQSGFWGTKQILNVNCENRTGDLPNEGLFTLPLLARDTTGVSEARRGRSRRWAVKGID